MPSNKDISSLVNTSDQTFLPPETKNSDVEMGVQEEQEHQLILDYYKLKAKNNLYSQLNNGPLTFLKFPTEVLNAIFVIILDPQLLELPCSHVFECATDRMRRVKGYNLSLKTIKSLRLTCQRTNILCSPLLLHSVRVELTLASLAHLEMVSTHPLISKGIRTVRISTSHYDPELYDRFEDFLNYKVGCLNGLLEADGISKCLDAQTYSRLDELSSLLSMRKLNGDIAEDVAEDVAEDDLSDHSSDEDFTEGDSSNEDVANCDFSDDSSDEDFTEGDSLDEDLAEGDSSGDQYVTQDVSSAWDVSTDENILRVKRVYIRAFFRFRSLFEDQERMMKNGTFIQAVTSAITRMPLAKTLHIHDRNRTSEPDCRQNASLYPKLHSLYDYARDDELFIEDLVKEEFGGEFVDLYFGEFPDWSSPYCQILFKLPIAIYKAGHLFDNISVEVTYPIDYNLKASPEEIKELSAASQNLKQFTFYCARRHYDGYNSQLPPQSLGGLIVYLSSVLNTDCLEKVDINLAYFNAHSIDIDEGHNRPGESLGSLFTDRKWPNLRSVHLFRVPFHLSEFRELLDGLKSPVLRLELFNNYLMSGEWHDALDTLRKKSITTLRLGWPSSTHHNEIWEYSYEEICEKGDTVAAGMGSQWQRRLRIGFNESS